jgi:hypothetical protein
VVQLGKSAAQTCNRKASAKGDSGGRSTVHLD